MEEVKKYTKKPNVVEAIKLEGNVESCNAVLAFIGTRNGSAVRRDADKPEAGITIYDEIEFGAYATPGEYVVYNERGEFEVHHSDVFEQLFDESDYVDHIPPIEPS